MNDMNLLFSDDGACHCALPSREGVMTREFQPLTHRYQSDPHARETGERSVYLFM